MNLVYLCGAPASGKSTLMAELTAGLDRLPCRNPFAHEVLIREGRIAGAELGARRESFSGTDALPLNVQPKATAWIRHCPYPLILGEGQRLANTGFLAAAAEAGYAVTLVRLTAPDDVLAARRKARGSNQDPSWIKGAASQSARLPADLELNAELPPGELAARLREAVPALGGM